MVYGMNCTNKLVAILVSLPTTNSQQ